MLNDEVGWSEMNEFHVLADATDFARDSSLFIPIFVLMITTDRESR